MEITSEELQGFINAYAIDFGEEISVDEAREMLTRLVQLYERVSEPLPVPPTVSYGSR
jgi:hypothetical protein